MSEALAQHEPGVFALRNARGSRARVSNLGCALMALDISGDNGETTDVVLGYDKPEDYRQDPCFFGVVVGRCAGRIARGRLELGGRDYQLPVADTGHHLHGGERGFDKRLWEVLEADDGGVRFRYDSPAGEEGYPGQVVVTVRYALTDDNEFIVNYTAESDRDTVVSPTQHSYFNLCGQGAGDILGHELEIDGPHFVPIDGELIPAGAPLPVDGTAMDFRGWRRVGDQLSLGGTQLDRAGGFDHSWMLAVGRDWQRRPAARVREPVSGRAMAVYTDRPALHFYSGNMAAAGVRGKGGAVYGPRHGFCLETQHLPTPEFDARAPAVRVSAQQPFVSETRFAFSGF